MTGFARALGMLALLPALACTGSATQGNPDMAGHPSSPADLSVPGSGGDLAMKSNAGSPDAAAAPTVYTCANSIYVATNGNDSNPGTAASPMKTIAKATPKANAGDCVLVHAGTYAESTTISFNADGTSAAPIVVWSMDGRGAAIVDAGGNRTGETVLIRHDYIVIDGFEFKNSPTDTSQQVVHFDGLNTGKCVGSVLRNCKVTGGYDHIKVNEAAQSVIIENNEFYGSFGHIPISLTGAPGLVFRGNFGHDWNTGGDGAVQLKGGSHDVLFDGNKFQDVTSSAGTIALGDGCDSTCDIDPDHYAAVRVVASNNLMVRVGRGFDIQGCKDCAVVTNTIVDSGASNVIFKLTTASTNGVAHDTVNARIEDNLVSNPKGDQGDIMQINGASGMGLQMDYNLTWNNGNAISWGDSHPASADTHSLNKDPKFTNAAGADYSLATGSPAIGDGINLYSVVPHDFNGVPRPANGMFDIGAFQSH